MKNLKITISGSAGSGKTSLAHSLANHFNLNLIHEDFNKLFKSRQNFINAQKKQIHSNPEVKEAFKLWMDSYFDWINTREKMYDENQNFVADRWEADLLSFWLRDFSSSKVDGRTLKLISYIKPRGEKINYAILLPSQIRADSPNDAGLMRPSNLCARISGTAMIYGIIRQYSNTQLIFIPPKIATIEDKIIFLDKIFASKNI